ncbi:MAG: hypothetical protein KDB00_01975 [Planctomycetales bacterium]|nr:hypothetical protein [Planctomycetales bacterium]
MDEKPRRIDPEFDKLTGTDVPFDDIGRNVEVLWVLSVHNDTIHQLVVVGEPLRIELL